MSIRLFEDIEAWQLGRQLTKNIYGLTKNALFSKDFSYKNQIQRAAGSSMHNIAEGYDSESNAEFIRFLRYAKRSCSEVQSQLYLALDNEYISKNEFEAAYELASRARAATRGFINYFVRNSNRKLDDQVHEDPPDYRFYNKL
jgi:four helix bundle protein